MWRLTTFIKSEKEIIDNTSSINLYKGEEDDITSLVQFKDCGKLLL